MISLLVGTLTTITACAIAAEWCTEHVDNEKLPKRFVEFFGMQKSEHSPSSKELRSQHLDAAINGDQWLELLTAQKLTELHERGSL